MRLGLLFAILAAVLAVLLLLIFSSGCAVRLDPQPPALPAAAARCASLFVDGEVERHYWIVAHLAGGGVERIGPVSCNAPAAVTVSQSVFVEWPAVDGATFYDVLLAAKKKWPADPECECAVATALLPHDRIVVDVGGPLGYYKGG